MPYVSGYITGWKDSPYDEFFKSNENKATLITQEVEKYYIQSFLDNTFNLAVLDSGCTKTLCRNKWLKCFVDSQVS